MKRLSVLFGGLLVLLSSCHFLESHKIRGNGNVTTNTHSISGFNGVDIGGAVDLYITQGDSYSVKVVTDENLHEYLEVKKEGSTLYIHPTNNTNLEATGGEIKVYVTAPVLESIEASGACSVKTENKIKSDHGIDVDLSGASDAILELNAPNIKVEASGATEITLKGETKNLAIDGSGSTNVKAFELLSETADVEISGAGDVDIYASVKLNAHTSGAAGIRYKGNATVDADNSGAGSVKKVN